MISFDCFDTLVTRKVAEPRGVWVVLEQKTGINGFAQMREAAEMIAVRNAGTESVKIADIYKAMNESGFIGKDQADELMHIEIEIEIEISLPLTENIEKAIEYVKKGEKLIVISDMYLPGDIIKRLLVKADPFFENITVFVSCEFGKTKYSSKLYKAIQKELNLKYTEWTHFGDNPKSDFDVPKKLGINAILLERKPLSCNFAKLLEKRGECAASQLIAGIANFLEKKNDAYNVGIFYGAVEVMNFCGFVLRRANELNIKRLYFVARDCYLPKLVCDILITRFKYEIKTEYIYLSKFAVKNALESGDTVAKEYFKNKIDISNNKFAFVDLFASGQTLSNVMKIIGYEGTVNLILFLRSYNVGKLKISFWPIPCISTYKPIAFMEVFFRAPHGKTVAWKRGDEIAPVFSEKTRKFPKYTDYISGVLDFAKQYAYFINDFATGNLTQSVYSILLQDKKAHTFLSEVPMDIDYHEAKEFTFIPRLSTKNIFDRFLLGLNMYIYEDLCMAGMTGIDRKIVKLCKKNKNSFIATVYARIRILYTDIAPKNEGKAYGDLAVGYHCYEKLFNKRIVLYGAGEFGRSLYWQLKITQNCEIALWADKKYDNVNKIVDYDFDYIVIAICNDEIVCDVRLDLERRGIMSQTIIWYGEL